MTHLSERDGEEVLVGIRESPQEPPKVDETAPDLVAEILAVAVELMNQASRDWDEQEHVIPVLRSLGHLAHRAAGEIANLKAENERLKGRVIARTKEREDAINLALVQRVEIRAAKDFGTGGFFWEKVSERTRNFYREDARKALGIGPSDPAASISLSDFGTDEELLAHLQGGGE